VNGSLERMRSRREDAAAHERYYQAAATAAERGAKLTRQLLAFARRTRLDPKATNLSDLIHGFAELLETSVGEKARLHLSLQRRLPAVRVDSTHLEMALLNIIVNARDASPAGGDITVTTRDVHLNGDAASKHLESGEYVMLCVTDHGRGMPPHVSARATEPFFTTKAAGQGTGLGLAMAHGFVEQSRGRLEIDSELGKGTTIRMYFPVHTDREEAEAQAGLQPQGFKPQPVDNSTAPPLILVVDDSREITDLAQEALTEIGYRVVVASSAEEALKRFEEARHAKDPFRLVFTDVLMPGGDNGIVLAERIRSRDPETPVLLTTGYNDEMALANATTGLDVLGKPYKRSELIDRVQSALRRGARTGPDRQTSDFGHAQA
jgi:CheY-like chemotaxis protein